MYGLKLIYRILNKEQRRGVLGLSILIIIGAFLELLGISLIFPAINLFVNPDDNVVIDFLIKNNLEYLVNYFELKYFFLFLFIIYFFKNIFLSILTWLQFKWASNIQIYFSKKLFEDYLFRPYLFHTKVGSSELFKNLEEIDMFGRAISNALSFITEVVIVSAIFCFLFYFQPYAALTTIGIFSILALAFYSYFRKKLNSLGKDRQSFLAGRVKSIKESFGSAIRDIKINNKEKEFLNIYDKFNSNYCNVGLIASTIQEIPKFIFEQFAILILLLLVIILEMLGKNNIETISILGLFLIATFRVLPSIRKILHSYQYINYGTASVQLIKNELESKNPDFDDSFHSQKNGVNIDLKSNIVFEKVNFYYDSHKSIFNNLNLRIGVKTINGIYGDSGAGKSTFVDLLAGLVKPTNGEIFVDNKNIFKNLKSWQNKIGYVSQKVHILDASIEENIIFSKNLNTSKLRKVEEVVKLSGLNELINSLPNGLKTQIGEEGSRLSGGQVQRLGIARALYKNPDILIFDESTSSLDLETEKQIFETIKNLKNEKTIFIISHQIKKLDFCDTIFEIKDKKMLENKSVF